MLRQQVKHTALPRSTTTLTTHWRSSSSNLRLPILEHLVCDIVGEGAGVFMQVVGVAPLEIESFNYCLDPHAPTSLVLNFTILIHLQLLTRRCYTKKRVELFMPKMQQSEPSRSDYILVSHSPLEDLSTRRSKAVHETMSTTHLPMSLVN